MVSAIFWHKHKNIKRVVIYFKCMKVVDMILTITHYMRQRLEANSHLK